MMARYSMVPILSPGGANKGGITRPLSVTAVKTITEARCLLRISQHLSYFRETGSDDLGVLTFDHFIVSDDVLVHHHRHVTPWPL